MGWGRGWGGLIIETSSGLTLLEASSHYDDLALSRPPDGSSQLPATNIETIKERANAPPVSSPPPGSPPPYSENRPGRRLFLHPTTSPDPNKIDKPGHLNADLPSPRLFHHGHCVNGLAQPSHVCSPL